MVMVMTMLKWYNSDLYKAQSAFLTPDPKDSPNMPHAYGCTMGKTAQPECPYEGHQTLTWRNSPGPLLSYASIRPRSPRKHQILGTFLDRQLKRLDTRYFFHLPMRCFLSYTIIRILIVADEPSRIICLGECYTHERRGQRHSHLLEASVNGCGDDLYLRESTMDRLRPPTSNNISEEYDVGFYRFGERWTRRSYSRRTGNAVIKEHANGHH